MNKILKGLVAVAATAAMAVAGFAGASAAMAVTTGSYTITVNEKNDKHTFNAYQVFKGDLKESQNEQGGVTSRALSNIEWGSGVSEAGKTALYNWASLTSDADKTAAKVAEKLTTNTGTVTAESFSNALAGKTGQAAHLTDTKVPLIQNAGKTAYTGTVTEAGYYLIVDEKTGEALGNNDAYSAYIMQVVGDVTVDPKSKTPTVKKEVQDEPGDKDTESQDQEGWGNTADHAIGESFNFRLTATIPGDANFKAYESYKVVFNDICKVLSEILLSNILVISKKGKVLGVSICPGVDEIHELIEDKVGGYVDKMFNERLLSVLSTKENVNLATLGFAEENVKKYQAIIAPIDIAGERLGTLFMYKSDEQYDIDDIILCEYGTTVVGLEMMRSVNEENAEETRKVQIVKSAISTLSFSELEAITHIFEELDGNEGILVASKIADRVGITRSVIVNALRKFESAGVIESRSSGMKGTYIKVLNDVVFDELKALKAVNAK